MRLYDCHVRLGGKTSNEVPLFAITAAEIIVLRHIHGDDSVVRVEPAGETHVNQFELRDQFRAQYERGEHQQGLIVALLGPDHTNNLPDALDPRMEAQYREAAAAKEKEEAEKKAADEAEINRRVQEQVAQIEADQKEAALQEAINKDDPAVLNPAQIAEHDRKFKDAREKAVIDKRARQAAEAEAAGPEAVAKNAKREKRNAQARAREAAAAEVLRTGVQESATA